MKLVKWLAILGAVIVIVVVAVPVAIVSFLDPNDFKGIIADQVRKTTGRELTITGDIQLEFWPKILLRTGEVTFTDAPGFGPEPMFEAREFQIAVATLPLLRRQIEMDTVKLYGARVRLTRNESGVNNWDDLMPPSDEPAQPLDLGGLALGGVDIQDMSIEWSDASTPEPQRVEISKLGVMTGPLTFGAPIDLAVNLTARATKPALDADVALKGTVAYQLSGNRYTLSPLTLDTTLRGDNLPNGSAEVNAQAAVDVNLGDGTAVVRDLTLTGLGTDLKGMLEATRIDAEQPSLKGDIEVTGSDLAMLFRVAELDAADQLRRVSDRSFALSTRFNADGESGDVSVPEFSMRLLGADIAGQLTARNAQTDAPAVAGKVSAQGPDLPAVLAVLGQFQGGEEKTLLQAAESLAGLPDKSFNATVRFDADLKAGHVDVAELSARGAGYRLEGRLNAANINSPKGPIEGQLTVRGAPAGPLLAAFGNPGLGDVVQNIEINTGVSGTTSDLTFAPLSIQAGVAGVQGRNEAGPLSIAAGRALANLDNETFTLSDFSVTGLGMNVKGSLSANKFRSTPDFNGNIDVAPFNLRQVMQSFNQEMPETADPKAFTRVGLSTEFKGTSNSLSLANLNVALDETTMTGQFALESIEPLAVSFGLGVDQVNADRYLPPKAKGEPNAPPSPEAAAAKAAELPVQMLRSIQAKGNLEVGELTISGARMQKVKVSIDARDGKIELNPVAAALYRGQYEGRINLNATGDVPRLGLQTSLTDVNIEPLLVDVLQNPESPLAGKTTFSAILNATGSTSAQIKRTLSGQGKFMVSDGVYRGIDIPAVLSQVEIMIESKRFGRIQKEGQTPFQEFSGTIDVMDGVVQNRDLLMLAPGFRVTGGGMLVDLKNDAIDYRLQADVDKSRVTRGEEDYDLGGYGVPIRCRGTLTEPGCLPDIEQIGKAVVKDYATTAIQRALGGRNATQDGAQGDEPDVGKEIGKALQGIFGRD